MEAPNRSSLPPGPRVALFSPYDGMGMGHIRRNLLITEHLISRRAASDVLMVSGSHEALMVPVTPGVDHLTIPGLRRQADGSYAARSMQMDIGSVIALRSEAICALMRAFKPDLLIVDKKPGGILGELVPTLRHLRGSGGTRIVLGLRDVLDDPRSMAEEWRDGRYGTIVDEFYDGVWVYGDRAIYDFTAEARLPGSFRRRVEFTGYLDQQTRLGRDDQPARDILRESGVDDAPFVLCMVGGGEDGRQLAAGFLQADFPPGWHGVLVAGPFMPTADRHLLHELAAARSRLHVVDHVSEPTPLIEASRRVICMGGYGATTEVLSLEKPTLVVPRVRPRTEQLIRAERFAELGLVDCLRPDELTPDALSAWMREDTRSGKGARERIDFGGLERIPRMAEALINGRKRLEPTDGARPAKARASRRSECSTPAEAVTP